MTNIVQKAIKTRTGKSISNIDLLNLAREKASEHYKASVPKFNDKKINHGLVDYFNNERLRNELLTLLVDKIGLTFIHNAEFETPLTHFKKNGVEFGDYIEEVHTLLVEKQVYDPKSTKSPLAPVDMKAIAFYHKISNKFYYEIEINYAVFKRAFLNEQNFDSFIDNIYSIPANSDLVDEFEIAKKVVADSFTPKTVELPSGQTEIHTPFTVVEKDDFVNNLISKILTVSSQFALPSRTQTNNAVKTPLVTPRDKQVLLINSHALTEIKLRKANTFNIDELGFTVQPIDFGSFPQVVNSELTNHELVAVLCSENSLLQFEQLYTVQEDQNARTLGKKYFLHHHYETVFSLIQNAHGFFIEK